jgi:O-antigen/teichoic acid export membrane protein
MAILPYIAPVFIQNPDYFADSRGMQIVPILLAANLFLGIYYTLSVWYKVSEQTKIGSLPAFSGAAITLILNLILIPKFGFVGSAYTTLITYIVMVLAGYLLSRKFYPIPYNLKLILPVLLSCFFLGWMIQQMPSDLFGVFYRSVLFFVFFGGLYLAEKKSSVKI